jgi:hypothetical protein
MRMRKLEGIINDQMINDPDIAPWTFEIGFVMSLRYPDLFSRSWPA